MNRILQEYKEKVEKLDIVKRVEIEGEIVTTIIEAPPFQDEYRNPIYDAELEAYKQMGPSEKFDFLIRNLYEEVA